MNSVAISRWILLWRWKNARSEAGGQILPYFESEAGHKIYYERHGRSGPVVILIHGLASSTRIWARQVRTLQKYCQVYTFDLPGHGQSDWQERYSLEEFPDLLKRLMDTCGIQRASLVAISLGCSVALGFAAAYPERVDKLVLEGPIGGYHVGWNPLGWPDQAVFGLLPFMLRFSISLFGYQATAHWINTFGVKAKRSFEILEAIQHQSDFKAIRDLLQGSATAPYSGHLDKVSAPTLLIRGQHDPMPKRFVDYIRTHLHRVTYVEVPETRHLVAMEEPREFNAMVLHFLNPVIRHKIRDSHEHSA
jgi:2-succinyl-6-hydroxy-2,4-cyclohexadiene-1-carboxylate synthase